jgi:hypothetical protein
MGVLNVVICPGGYRPSATPHMPNQLASLASCPVMSKHTERRSTVRTGQACSAASFRMARTRGPGPSPWEPCSSFAAPSPSTVPPLSLRQASAPASKANSCLPRVPSHPPAPRACSPPLYRVPCVEPVSVPVPLSPLSVPVPAHWDKSEGAVMSVEVGPAVVSTGFSGRDVGGGPPGGIRHLAYGTWHTSVGKGVWGVECGDTLSARGAQSPCTPSGRLPLLVATRVDSFMSEGCGKAGIPVSQKMTLRSAGTGVSILGWQVLLINRVSHPTSKGAFATLICRYQHLLLVHLDITPAMDAQLFLCRTK